MLLVYHFFGLSNKSIDFPEGSETYNEFVVYFKVLEINKGKPGLLMKKNKSMAALPTQDDKTEEYQLKEEDFNFEVGTEFNTSSRISGEVAGKAPITSPAFGPYLKRDMCEGGLALQHQAWNPSGNEDVDYTIEVVKMVFIGDSTPVEPPPPPPEYVGKTAVALLDGSIVDYDPSVLGVSGMTIDEKTGVVSMTEDSVLYYKFPTKVALSSEDGAPTEDIDIEAEYDYVEFEYTISDVVPGEKTAGGPSDGKFKARVRDYSNVKAYTGFAGASEWPSLGEAGANTFKTQTLGAQGSGGIAINYNWNDRNADGALSLKVKITKVTFTKGNRVNVQFINNEGPVFYKAVTFLDKNGPRDALPSAADVGARTGYTFVAWVKTPGDLTTIVGATDEVSYDTTLVPYWYEGTPPAPITENSTTIHSWLFSDNPGNTATMNLANPDSCEMPATGPQIWGFQLSSASGLWMMYDTLVITMTISDADTGATTNLKASSGTNPWGSDYTTGGREGMSGAFTAIADGTLVLTVPISSFPGGTFACQRNGGGYKFKITKVELKM